MIISHSRKRSGNPIKPKPPERPLLDVSTGAPVPRNWSRPRGGYGRLITIIQTIIRIIRATICRLRSPYHRSPTIPCVVYNNRSEEHTSELQSRVDLVCRLLLEKKKTK